MCHSDIVLTSHCVRICDVAQNNVCSGCSDGIGRTGAFLVIYTGVQEVNQGNPLVDVLPLVRQLRAKRKHMITEKEQLRLCFNTILYHCQDVLMKSTSDFQEKCH